MRAVSNALYGRVPDEDEPEIRGGGRGGAVIFARQETVLGEVLLGWRERRGVVRTTYEARSGVAERAPARVAAGKTFRSAAGSEL